MALESRLDLRLSQKLVLTPQLQQAIKLLQMSQLELSQTLKHELMENPFLEELSEPDTNEYFTEELPHLSSNDDTELSFRRDLIDFGVDEYFKERASDGRDLGYFSSGVEEQPSYELFYSKKPDLYDHLLWQLRLCHADDDLRKVAEVVIGNIDSNGYLLASEEELASMLGVDVEMVRSAIALVHSFDPPGVGARDLKECLLLQIAALNLNGTLVEKIINNNMEDLQKKKYSSIAKQYNSSIEDVMAAVKIIERLEPRPGIGLSSSEIGYIVPDVYISKIEGGYQIRLNDEHVPKIGLNRRLILTSEEKEYLKNILKTISTNEKIRSSNLLKKLSGERVNLVFNLKEEEREALSNILNRNFGPSDITIGEKAILKEKLSQTLELDEGEKNFLKEKFRLAKELIEGLDQRNKTIYKVSESILKFQRDFFDKGMQYLKPLNLKDVASDVNMHESTISRVTSNKFLACDYGIFSFRFFFSSSIKTDNGNISSASVKDLIKKIVSEEDAKKPFSDQMIAEKLKQQNINIARRTVAKYREELRIPPQNLRKRS